MFEWKKIGKHSYLRQFLMFEGEHRVIFNLKAVLMSCGVGGEMEGQGRQLVGLGDWGLAGRYEDGDGGEGC